jgi:hypothetical protein
MLFGEHFQSDKQTHTHTQKEKKKTVVSSGDENVQKLF